MDALVAEATTTLLEITPRECIETDIDASAAQHDAQRAWERELRRMRDAAEALCEATIAPAGSRSASGASPPKAAGGAVAQASRGGQGPPKPNPTPAMPTGSPLSVQSSLVRIATAMDTQLRAFAAELSTRNAAYGRTLERFFRADGWRRLGYATAAAATRVLRTWCHLHGIHGGRIEASPPTPSSD